MRSRPGSTAGSGGKSRACSAIAGASGASALSHSGSTATVAASGATTRSSVTNGWYGTVSGSVVPRAVRLRAAGLALRGELAHQPRLADARLAADEHEPAVARDRRVPPLAQRGELRSAADERQRGERGRAGTVMRNAGAGRLRDGIARGCCILLDRRVHRARFRHRLGVQLVAQRAREPLVLLQRAGAVTRFVAQPHQRAQHVVAPRVVREQPLRGGDRGREVARRAQARDQRAERAAVQRLQPRAFGLEPFVRPRPRAGRRHTARPRRPRAAASRRAVRTPSSVEPQIARGIPLELPGGGDHPGPVRPRRAAAARGGS